MPGRHADVDPDDPPRLVGAQLSGETLATLQFLSAAIRRESGVALGTSAIVRALVGWLSEADIDTRGIRSAADLRKQLGASPDAAGPTAPRLPGRGLRESERRDTAFGARIQALREARQLSIRRTARLAGISDAYLWRMERGLVPPASHVTLAKLAAVLHADADELSELAARIPDDVSSRVLRRPRLMGRLIRGADRLNDEDLGRLLREIEGKNPSGA